MVAITKLTKKAMKEDWYSVKCLLHHPTRKKEDEAFLYEERTTLWKADSFDAAYLKAEREAVAYAIESHSVFVQPVSAFKLFDEIVAEGTEVDSTIRGSNLSPVMYRDTFCNTVLDRATHKGGTA